MFGHGDLFLYNHCNLYNSGTYAYFPTSYSNEKYVNSHNSYMAFTGQKNGYTFKVIEYEVFKVIWN